MSKHVGWRAPSVTASGIPSAKRHVHESARRLPPLWAVRLLCGQKEHPLARVLGAIADGVLSTSSFQSRADCQRSLRPMGGRVSEGMVDAADRCIEIRLLGWSLTPQDLRIG